MKLLIGIPAFNEGKMIKDVVNNLPKNISGIKVLDTLVVDDGSFDETAFAAKKAGALVLTHMLNRGLGGALKTIFHFAKTNKYDILVTFDADGQHDASDIAKIVSPIINDSRDVVIGTRWKLNKDVPLSRKIINKLANILTLLLFSIWAEDSQSGFRAFNRKAINLIDLQSDGMEVSSEIFREIYRHKLKLSQVPIMVRYTKYSRAKGQKLTNAPNVFFHLFMRLLR